MDTACDHPPDNIPDKSQASPPTVPRGQNAFQYKPVIVGIYGVPGCGKSFLLKHLKKEFGVDAFNFYEGSSVIAQLVPGGLQSFKKLPEQEMILWRQRAIETIKNECVSNKQGAVVTGHFMFWFEGAEAGQSVYTRNDLETYTHILYLDVPADIVAQRRLNDKERDRPILSLAHLQRWMDAEKTQLLSLCRENGILFSILPSQSTMLAKVYALLWDFRLHHEDANLYRAVDKMSNIVTTSKKQLDTVLMMDADKTLAAVDTGKIFWDVVARSHKSILGHSPLKHLFRSPMGYSYLAFRQATLLYESFDDEEFEEICKDVASQVTIHPELLALSQQTAGHNRVGAVIVTCGIRRIWEMVLDIADLSDTVKVIGGGRISDGFVVTPKVKAALVMCLQDMHHMYVVAFGDSPLDLPMLCKADQAIVAVGEEKERSKTMDVALLEAINDQGLQASQVLLPPCASLRLDTAKLPLIQLNPGFIDSISYKRRQHPGLQVIHATDRPASRLLMTPGRDARVSGHALRENHRRAGLYLATELVTGVVGLEEYTIPHVQGNEVKGYRLKGEEKTSIVALMRGGEPMAFGVSEAFPLAMFVHASEPKDIKPGHLEGQRAVLLVDSVVNNGKTVLEFVQHIRSVHSTICIVVITGVAQAQTVAQDGNFFRTLSRCGNVSLVALRLSDNKFTGRGGTDTGNRLFNTTHLP